MRNRTIVLTALITFATLLSPHTAAAQLGKPLILEHPSACNASGRNYSCLHYWTPQIYFFRALRRGPIYRQFLDPNAVYEADVNNVPNLQAPPRTQPPATRQAAPASPYHGE